MGQYFIPTIFRKESNISDLYARYDEDKAKYQPVHETPVATLCSHDFKFRETAYDGKPMLISIGLKFMEHCYIGNPLCRAVEHLLANEYAGCPVVWGGDYSDYELFINQNTMNGEPRIVNAYFLSDKPLEKRTRRLVGNTRNYNHWHRYLINHDTNEYVKIPRCKSDEYQIHPLPVLTCDSYTGGVDTCPLLGIWKGHHLSVSNEKPSLLYKELIFDVKED